MYDEIRKKNNTEKQNQIMAAIKILIILNHTNYRRKKKHIKIVLFKLIFYF